MSTNLNEILYPFQKEDASKMLEGPKLMNGSEMGVGKTETTIKVMQDIGGKRNLIVAPGGMVLEWKERLKRYGEGDVALPSSNGYRLDTSHFKHKYLIVNYEMLRVPNRRKRKWVASNYIDVLEIPPWDCIIFDEAHRLKNPDAQQTKGARRLAVKNGRVHLLSGTIFLNFPNELWSPLDMLHPGEFGDYWEFAKEYCSIIPGQFGPRIVGVRKKRLPELREILSKMMIRREKVDVLGWLPDKTYREIPLTMHASIRSSYDELEKELFTLLDNGESIWAKSSLALLMKLRQLSLDSRLLGGDEPSTITSVLLELVDDIVKSGKQVVVFSWFASYLELLAKMLRRNGRTVEIISGRERDEAVRRDRRLRFQNGEAEVLLGSIETAVGYDLTAADICIFTDRYWVPMKNVQAEDRLHRIGQKGNVLVIDLVVRDSIYQDIARVLSRKEEAFGETIALERAIGEMRSRRQH